MTRTANERRPEELLDAIANYLSIRGLSGLSLRPLAKAVGSSPRVLLYYFGSKELLIAKLFEHLRIKQREWLDAATGSTLQESCLKMWRRIIRPDTLPWFRVFFEAFGFALGRADEYEDFLNSVSRDWIQAISRVLRDSGCGRREAEIIATVVLAGFRGFMLDYCATHDRKRIQSALEWWARGLDLQLASVLERG